VLFLFVLLGTTECELRDTSGYCQCDKICPLGSGEEVCVAMNDPQHGCASESCEECRFTNGTATCGRDGECTLGGCVTGFADCDGDPKTGCETNYRNDIQHCGNCYTSCPGAKQHAESTCTNGLCNISCLDGYKDCNRWTADGCETEPNTECDAGVASAVESE
jgi:hypothetical protein